LTSSHTGWTTRIQDRRTYKAPPRTSARPHTPVSTCVQDSVFNKPNLLQNLATSSMFLSRGLTCYNTLRAMVASYKNPNWLPNATYRQETRMHAHDGLQAPMLPKCRQHGLTYLTGWTTGHPRIVELRARPPKDQVHDPTHRQRACKIGLQQAQILQNLRPPLDVLSKGLTCYTDVESNGRDASYQNPNQLPNVRPTSKRHACTRRRSLQAPMLPKSVASTV
jgi:hypothetical protein